MSLAANLTLALKYIRLQREANKALRESGEIWIGNVSTGIFFITVLVTMILMFARTVALQVGRMAMLDPEKKVAGVTLNYFTPNYKKLDQILNRQCMKTVQIDGALYNVPTWVSHIFMKNV